MRNPIPGIQNPQREFQHPRLCWITLHRAKQYGAQAATFFSDSRQPEVDFLHS